MGRFELGPLPAGYWTAQVGVKPCRHLEPGRWYRVVRAFSDSDRQHHLVGERWKFLTSSFFPYDEEYFLVVSQDGQHEWMFGLTELLPATRQILSALETYIEAEPDR